MNHFKISLRRRGGFALVTALSLMAFVLLLLLSLSTIVQVESKSVDIALSKLKAEQAAILAAHLAIGQLQKMTGADTRVTADSRMFDTENVKLTGAWRSWEGSDRDFNSTETRGQAIAPDYASKLVFGDADMDLAASGDGRFLGWLSSIADRVANDPNAPLPATLISAEETGDLVPIVSSGSVPVSEDEVYIATTTINGEGRDQLRYAWWTSGDNAKAMVQVEPSDAPASIRDWKQRLQSPSTADPEVFDLEKIEDLPVGESLSSRASLGFFQGIPESLPFHDLTVFNRGLLTNTATGGWRRDLSLMTESYDGYGVNQDGDPSRISTDRALPEDDLPFYTLRPGEITFAKKADITSRDLTAGALVYPWAEYKPYQNTSSPRAWMRAGPVCSWTSLVDYAMKYKDLDTFGASSTNFPKISQYYWPARDTGSLPGGAEANIHRFVDKVRMAPVLARLQWVFALASRPNPADSSKYDLLLLANPSVTIWNPYSVQIEIPEDLYPGFNFNVGDRLQRSFLPLEFEFESGRIRRTENIKELLEKTGSGNINSRKTIISFPRESLVLPPGATRIYSAVDYVENTRNLNLEEGYRAAGGFLFPLSDFSGLSEGALVRILRVEAHTFTDGGDNVFELYSDFESGGVDTDAWRAQFVVDDMGASVFEDLYPPLIDSSNPYTEQVQNLTLSSGGDYAFAVGIMASRASTPLVSVGDSPSLFHDAVKFGEMSPLSYYASAGKRSMRDRSYTNFLPFDRFEGSGLNHPVNAVFSFGFRRVNGWGDTENPGWIPQSSLNNESYIISGLDATYGASRAVVAEIPTRPLQSLADLQHWDVRNNNPIPPYRFNIIGNSSASPIIPADKVSIVGDADVLTRFCLNDDSYLLNNLLFDDWFVSSIAPDYGDSGVRVDRSLREVFTEHLTGEEKLPNRFYLPTQTSTAANLSDTPELEDLIEHVASGDRDAETGQYAFENVASHLQVAGMFNVNSTSVDAWRAFLRQGRDLEVPFVNGQGVTDTDEMVSFAFPRTSIAGSTAVQSGALFGQKAAGYQAFTEEQIDALAEQIVNEIRDRGPFLSLSEFINRQLTTADTDKALAGTIQKALDNLADLGDDPLNPFSELQNESIEISSLPPGDPGYDFEEAAYGHTAYGLPGWVRQADILRPLAPALSARDDTFTIRAYGDYRDPTDPSVVLAKAWCEVTVTRTAGFVDPVDDATVLPYSNNMSSETNRRMGRQYQIVSFRWLNEDEV